MPGAANASYLVERAEDALRRAHADPSLARDLALSVIPEADHDPMAASLAHEALGLAAQQRSDPDEAVGQYRTAVALAERAGLETRAAQARIGLCHALLVRGDPEAALRETDLAAGVLDGADAGTLLMRRGLVLQRLGQLEEALGAYDEALLLLERAEDRVWQAKLRTNRGVLHVYRSAFAAAERDLLLAEQLYDELGQTLASAQVRHNLGFLAARRRDIPEALRCFDLAAAAYERLGMTDLVGLADRCELLLSSRLLGEARELATHAVAELERAHMESDLAEARLCLANVELLLGATSSARAIAKQAERAFLHQQRNAWAVMAGYVVVRADWQAGDRTEQLVLRARRSASDLAEHGWTTAAADARLVAARVALERGEVGVAERELAHVRSMGSEGPIELRARAWHAEALLRLAHGNRRGADSALRAGMRLLDRHRSTLGATELRVHVAGHVRDLALLGTRLALESGDGRRVLSWAERWRAGALFLRPARPPDDEELVTELAELRQTVAELDDAAVSGGETAHLLARQASLERSVQVRSRHARGADGAVAGGLALDELFDELGSRALVEMVRLEDELVAVVVADGKARLRRLGSHDLVVNELEHLRFALRRLATDAAGSRARQRARRSVEHAAQALDRAVFGPLRAAIGERPLVIVPTGALHAVPWTALPSCQGRPVTVAPSALTWCRAMHRACEGTDAGEVLLVGCSSPPHAIGEIEHLREHYPDSTALIGEQASVAAVTEGLERAAVAHLACHGRFRADNPLFSCLKLADGPLTVHDLERRSRTPALLLLSACDSGLSAVRPGDELMGLSSALFAAGTATLVASVIPVPDWATRRLMVRFHQALALGDTPTVALASAAANASSDGERVAAAGFVCFGAG